MWSSLTGTSKHFVLAAAAVFSALLATAPAQAVLQPTPGGFTIPTLDVNQTNCADKNVEVCIDQSEGNATLINIQNDALVSPEVFTPTCTLTFTPIAKGGGDHVAFGWYNIKPDPANAGKFLKPTQEELYGMVVLAVGNTQGATLTTMFPPVVLNLPAEEAAGRYKGGEIGFWLAGSGNFSSLVLNPTTHALTGMTLDRVFYTQHSLNPGSDGAKTFYQVLTWQSVTFKNSFYFGWEDRVASADADNDFDDLAFLVSGIQCAGGGEACDTGKLGVCKDGTLQCQKGELTCVQSIQPSDEECNALDDDCDGMVDQGDGLCEVGKVCDRGRCVPKCGTGEFKCATDLVCTSRGVCVEPACAKMECPAGQVCHDGACIDSCMGVTCPHGSVCRNGGCVDPCQGIVCDEGFTCSEGVCQSCECSECTGGQVCGATNICVDTGCEAQTCAAGTHCSLGACVDDCAGAVCPQGQICQMGGCVADPNANVGGGTGMAGTDNLGGSITLPPNKGGTTSSSNGGSSSEGGTKPDPGPMLSSGQGDAEAAKGCACSVPSQHGGLSALGGLALAAALGLARRRRRAA